MLHSKDEALKPIKVFKAEVEKQRGKKRKVMRLDKVMSFKISTGGWTRTWYFCKVS